MARKRVCGFETGSTQELAVVGGTYSIQSTTVHSGAYAFQANPTGAGTGYCRINGLSSAMALADLNIATSYCKFNYRQSLKPALNWEDWWICRNTASGRKTTIRMNSAGNLAIYDSALALVTTVTGFTFTASKWFCIEIMNTSGAGSTSFALRIDGVTQYSGSFAQGNFNIDSYDFGKVGNNNNQSVNFFYDDVVIDDATWPQESYIINLTPSGAGSSTGWTNTYSEVDEIPPNSDTDYIESSTSGQVENVDLTGADTSGIREPIRCIQPWYSCKNQSGTSLVAGRTRFDGTNLSDSSNRTVAAAYEFLARIHETNSVTSKAWRAREIDLTEVGVVDTSVISHTARCSAMGLMVEFAVLSAGSGLYNTIEDIIIPKYYRTQRINWLSDYSGNFEKEVLLQGWIDRIETFPDPNGLSPTDNYDIIIANDLGEDILLGLGANRDTITPEKVFIYKETTTQDLERIFVNGIYRVKISNAGAYKAGLIAIFTIPTINLLGFK